MEKKWKATCYDPLCKIHNKPMTSEWTVRPVHKKDGTEWPGIGYISDGQRTYGSANLEEAKAIVTAINAALAAERENTKDAQEEAFSAYAEGDALREQLAADPSEKWTVERVRQMYFDAEDQADAFDEIASAHNAALAANDHKWNLARLMSLTIAQANRLSKFLK
jgi:hypothetical protein